jgi:hypothetical protein
LGITTTVLYGEEWPTIMSKKWFVFPLRYFLSLFLDLPPLPDFTGVFKSGVLL